MQAGADVVQVSARPREGALQESGQKGGANLSAEERAQMKQLMVLSLVATAKGSKAKVMHACSNFH